MTRSIRWDRLSQTEHDFLERIGVQMLDLGMAFTRAPSWDEFTVAFAYIFAIKNRSLPDEDDINWAIGDCLNEGSEYFGEEKVFQWVDKFLELLATRDTILNMAGGTLILLQQLEDVIKFCCSMVNIDGLSLTINDFFSEDPKRRRKTLGQLARALINSNVFATDVEDRLDAFVGLRNEFIHNLWVETYKQFQRTIGLPPREEFEEIFDFISKLIVEAHYFDRVFRGFKYELLSSIHKEGSPESSEFLPLESWTKYISEFQKALRGEESDTDDAA